MDPAVHGRLTNAGISYIAGPVVVAFAAAVVAAGADAVAVAALVVNSNFYGSINGGIYERQ